MDKRLIKKLIESYVDDAFKDSSIFLEAENDELDLGGGDDLGGGGADDLGDLDFGDEGGGDLDGGDGGGELDLDGGDGGEGDLDGEEGEDDFGGDTGGGDLGGGGGGFGGGGGGGGDFGGDDDFGDGEDDGDGEDGEVAPEEVEMSADPVQSAVNIAIKMLDETGDDNQILSAVKASIQGNFEDFRDAEPIITSLWATEHPILKVVARKLLLFISGR